jgi:signal transduction histidine kinase
MPLPTKRPTAAAASENAELLATRAQLAFELHDNIIQTLISADLRFEALRQSNANGHLDEAEFAEATAMLRYGIAELRDLMERLRPPNVQPADLPHALALIVERFKRDSITKARLIVDPVDSQLSPSTCRALLRITQEALNNVRRHSGAKNVLVRLRHQEECWRLSIDDDGCGFPFEGVWSLDQLDKDRRGPVVIKERVRDIGAGFVIDSQPGRGARLEIVVPTSKYAR